MTHLPRLVCRATLAGALALVACSSDSPGTGSMSGSMADAGSTTAEPSPTRPGGAGGGSASGGSGGGTAITGSGGNPASGGSGGRAAGGSGGGGAGGGNMALDGGTADAPREAGSMSADSAARDGAPAGAMVATSKLMPTGQAGFTMTSGLATFTQVGNQVTLVIDLDNCPKGAHATHLHETANCGNGGNAAGNHWPNGEGLGEIQCGDNLKAHFEFKRGTDKWTVGGAAATDITRHALMVHRDGDAAPGDRVACGTIVVQ